MTFLFSELNHARDATLRFALIMCQYRGKWVYVRHRERSTFEQPGGHIEQGESPDAAARRELFEETGALEYSMTPLCDCYVPEEEDIDHGGRLYYARIEYFGPLPEHSEMAQVKLFNTLPPVDMLTYPEISPVLYRRVLALMEERPEYFEFDRQED